MPEPPRDNAAPGVPLSGPLYKDVKRRLTESLTRGEWKPGEAIPAERMLSERCGTSIGTIRRAIDELVAENILIRQQGRGTYVASHNRDRMLFYFFHIVDDEGTKRYPEVELLSFARAKADRTAAELLGLAPGDGVYRIRNRLSLAGTPVIIDDITLPVATFPGLTERQFRDRTSTIYNLYQEAFGVSVVRASERLRATRRRRRDRSAAVDRPQHAAAAHPPRRALLQRGSDRASRLAGRHDAKRVLRRYRQARRSGRSSRVSFASFFAQLLNGLAGASALFLVAAGLTLIFGVTRVVNFAHGSLYMLGAFIAYSLVSTLPRGPLGFWGGVIARGARGRAHRRGDRGAAAETHLRRAGAAAARRHVRHRADRSRRRACSSGAPRICSVRERRD